MTDTAITLTPSAAFTSGAVTVTASAALFNAVDIQRALAIWAQAPDRLAAHAYGAGAVFVSSYAGVNRLYRVVIPGTTAAANMAGTTPDYDLNAPRDIGLTILDGSATIKYLGSGKQCWGFGVISTVASQTVVTVTVDPRGPFVSTDASVRWKLGEFSDARGWPAAVTFHLQRTWWGGTLARPQTVWASQVADFDNMTPTEPDGTVLATSAITISLDDDQINAVRWLASFTRGLAVGTSSAEFTIGPENTLAALAPGNIKAVHQTDRGSDIDNPQLRAPGAILFMQRGAQKLREFSYDLASDAFATIDLTQLSDHITGPGVIAADYAGLPDGVAWLVRSDGTAATLTYDREQKVRAWCRQQLGGTDAVIESVAIVPAPDGASDDVYLAVCRTITGVRVRTIEYIRRPFRSDLDAPADGYFVDAGLTYRGAPANNFTGLEHLEGETVRIVADGSQRNDQVVHSGAVAITGPAARVVHIGLAYRHRFESLPPNVQGDLGTAQGQLKRISEITLRFLDTAGGAFGRDGQTEPIVSRTLAMAMTEAVPLFTGDRRVKFPAGWDRAGQVIVEGTDALPMTLLAIVTDVQTNG